MITLAFLSLPLYTPFPTLPLFHLLPYSLPFLLHTINLLTLTYLPLLLTYDGQVAFPELCLEYRRLGDHLTPVRPGRPEAQIPQHHRPAAAPLHLVTIKGNKSSNVFQEADEHINTETNREADNDDFLTTGFRSEKSGGKDRLVLLIAAPRNLVWERGK